MSLFWFLAPYCSLNPTLRNGGIINKTGGPAGSKVHYYCKPGYRMIGHNNATCRRYQNGMYQWDSPVPICHGKIMLSSWTGFYNFIVRLFHKTKMQHCQYCCMPRETLTLTLPWSKHILICVFHVYRVEVLRTIRAVKCWPNEKHVFSTFFFSDVHTYKQTTGHDIVLLNIL